MPTCLQFGVCLVGLKSDPHADRYFLGLAEGGTIRRRAISGCSKAGAVDFTPGLRVGAEFVALLAEVPV